MNTSQENQVSEDACGIWKMLMCARIITLLTALTLPFAARAEVVSEWNVDGKERLPSWAQLYALNAEAKLSLDPSAISDAGRGAIKVEVVKASSTSGHADIQFWIVKDDGIAAGKYRLTVLVKGGALDGVFHLALIQNDAPYAHFDSVKTAKLKPLDLDEKWEKVTLDFEALSGFEGKKLRVPCFVCGALPSGYTFWIASVKLEELP